MKLRTALIIPVIILLTVLILTLFSYNELQSVLASNLGIESHARNLILLDDLETHTNDMRKEIQKIQNSESVLGESFSNNFERMNVAKNNMNQITESNLELDSNFLQKFSKSSNVLFTNIDLLNESTQSQKLTEISDLFISINNELDHIDLLIDTEFTNEKTTFLLLHEIYLEKHAYANFLVFIVIVTSLFLLISVSFWIYKSYKLTELDTKKSEFASMITHELKTPLTPIITACQLLNEEIIGKLNESQKEEIETIQRNANSLLKIIIDILDAQKLDMGKLVFSNSKFKISSLFDELKSDNMSLLNEKNVKFELEIQDDVVIDSDKNRIHQVFNNLIKNSLDFVKSDSGIIKIGCNSEKTHVTFFVKDNGIGIPKDDQKNLFQSFYQIDTSITRKHGGTGLGLTVCKGIIEGLNGTIWIQSVHEKGTTVYFKIPINQI